MIYTCNIFLKSYQFKAKRYFGTGSVEFITFLLDSGMSPNSVIRMGEDEFTILQYICYTYRECHFKKRVQEVFQLLIDRGADPNLRKNCYQTPALFFAAQSM